MKMTVFTDAISVKDKNARVTLVRVDEENYTIELRLANSHIESHKPLITTGSKFGIDFSEIEISKEVALCLLHALAKEFNIFSYDGIQND